MRIAYTDPLFKLGILILISQAYRELSQQAVNLT